ncbi:MAG: AMP phosphorylase, partial [Candidatus Woesearchaeota archaeon]|nr:AMP phosphorylase [Candidatus Woesearchaeota archaeon]
VLDIAEKEGIVSRGKIGLFEEVLKTLRVRAGEHIEVSLAPKPNSVLYIRQKLDGKTLAYPALKNIMQDIVNDKLSEIELTSYVTANYTRGMSLQETYDLTRAMTDTGQSINFHKKQLVDLHCIGGVPGNRTTLIVVPILVAAGLFVPKTASRAITSPAGTADTMEVLAPVSFSQEKLQRILNKAGGFIVWGGAMNLAPADEKIIRVEYPLSIDAEGQMLASIMAKKASVGATHVLIDIPIGIGSKVPDFSNASRLRSLFSILGSRLGMQVKVMLSDGSEPIGNGIGPCLEAKDCLRVLEGEDSPNDLRGKSLELAAILLEFTRTAKKGKGRLMAERLLNSGKAWEVMQKIIRAQGGKRSTHTRIPLSHFSGEVIAPKSGIISHVENSAIAKIARLAGAPSDKTAGVYLHAHKGNNIHRGDILLTVYSESEEKLAFAKEFLRTTKCMLIK